jgi:hypothetical protein
MGKRYFPVIAIAGALALAASGALAGSMTLYEKPEFQGRSVATVGPLPNVERSVLDDDASSVIVDSGTWEACTRANFRGTCAELAPGHYHDLDAQLNGAVRSVREIAGSRSVTHVVVNPDVAVTTIEPARRATVVPSGRAVLYENPNFSGAFAVVERGNAPDLDWARFTNPATSIRVESGSWLVCSDMGYEGDCRVLEPGNYPTLPGMTGIRSARQVWRTQYGYADLPTVR